MSQRHIARAACIAVAAGIAVQPSAALARAEISPFIELQQVLTADLNNGGDVLTYSVVAVGADADISNNRTQIQASYRYERRFAWEKNVADENVHSGIVRGRHELIPNTLAIEGGALAARARTDFRGSAPGILVGNVDNVTQIWSAYVGPTLTTNIDQLQVGAAYRLGYTKAEANNVAVVPGQPRLDQFDDSVSHLAQASLGMKPGAVTPFGWTVSGAYEREDAGQLDQRFESKGVRADFVQPVTPTVALVGGVGYEDIEVSQREPLRDVNGAPVIDSKGRFVTDPASPRLLAYNFDGIYWDVGVAWRPSRRTNLEARFGRRYGSWSGTGSFTYQLSSDTAIGAVVYDQVQTFGQSLNDNLALVPVGFLRDGNDPFGNAFGSCVFGGQGSGAGGCLNPALAAVNSSAFRSRGVSATASHQRGPWRAGLGVGYVNRKYLAPDTGLGFTVNGTRDEAWFGQGQLGYRIDENSSIDGTVFAALYDPGIAGAGDVFSVGGTAAYHRAFGRNLSGVAAVGIYSTDVEGFASDVVASALLGVRLQY